MSFGRDRWPEAERALKGAFYCIPSIGLYLKDKEDTDFVLFIEEQLVLK